MCEGLSLLLPSAPCRRPRAQGRCPVSRCGAQTGRGQGSSLQVGTQGSETPTTCSKSRCLEVEKPGLKPAGAPGGEAEKAGEVSLRRESPAGGQPTGRERRKSSRGEEVLQPVVAFLGAGGRPQKLKTGLSCVCPDSVTLSKSFPISGLQLPHL